MIKISAILLAAGTSSRMGKRNKLFIPFDGKPMFIRCLEEIVGAAPAEIIVVTGYEHERVKHSLPASASAKVVENSHYDIGMTSSIQAGVRTCDPGTHAFMICLSDMPLIKSEDYRLLMDFFKESKQRSTTPIVAPSYKGRRGNPIIFDCSYRQEILDHREAEGCRKIVKDNSRQQFLRDFDRSQFLMDFDSL